MIAIHAQTERKRLDRSVRCAEKRRPWARKQRLRGLIRPDPAVCATAGAACGRKSLSSARIQAIFTSNDTPLGECRLSFGGKVKFTIVKGWKATKYDQSQFKSVEEIDAEVFRSGGKAAAGAIIGGVLTGGIGFLAGAAYGGRKRKTASYLIHFEDGEYIAYEEKNKSVIKVFDRLVEKQAVQMRLADKK